MSLIPNLFKHIQQKRALDPNFPNVGNELPQIVRTIQSENSLMSSIFCIVVKYSHEYKKQCVELYREEK